MLGLKVKKTVPAKLLKNYETFPQKNELKEKEKQDNKHKNMKIANGFNYYVREIKLGVA